MTMVLALLLLVHAMQERPQAGGRKDVKLDGYSIPTDGMLNTPPWIDVQRQSNPQELARHIPTSDQE